MCVCVCACVCVSECSRMHEGHMPWKVVYITGLGLKSCGVSLVYHVVLTYVVILL